MNTPTELHLRVDGIPVPQGSKKALNIQGKCRVIDDNSAALKRWRQAVTNNALNAAATMNWTAPDGPIRVDMVFYTERPGYHFTKAGLRPDAPRYNPIRPDLDKYVRAAFDSLTDAHVIVDDSRVAILSGMKLYANPGETPGVRIIITTITEDGTAPQAEHTEARPAPPLRPDPDLIANAEGNQRILASDRAAAQAYLNTLDEEPDLFSTAPPDQESCTPGVA